MVVVSDALKEAKPDAFWLDGYLADPGKMYEAALRCYPARTRKPTETLTIEKGEDYLNAALGWLDTQGGIRVYEKNLFLRTPSCSYPALRHEVVYDPQRNLYRAVMLIRTDRRGVRNLGKLRTEASVAKLLEDWGMRIKRPQEYRDIEAFVADCRRVLAEIAKPYREAGLKAWDAADACFPGGTEY